MISKIWKRFRGQEFYWTIIEVLLGIGVILSIVLSVYILGYTIYLIPRQ